MPDPIVDCGFFLKNPTGNKRRAIGDDGEVVYEKVPYTIPNPQRLRRWRQTLKHDGSIGPVVLTAHAANLDIEGPQARYYKHKGRMLGWLPTESCPVALIINGEMEAALVCKELRQAVEERDICARGTFGEFEPCKHIHIEKEVRRERRRKETQKKEAEAFGTVKLRADSEQSTLVNVSEAVSATASLVLQIAAWWVGTADKPQTLAEQNFVVQSTDFVGAKIDGQTLEKLMTALQLSAISWETFFYNCQTGELYQDGWTREDEEAAISRNPVLTPPLPKQEDDPDDDEEDDDPDPDDDGDGGE